MPRTEPVENAPTMKGVIAFQGDCGSVVARVRANRAIASHVSLLSQRIGAWILI